MTAVCQLSTRCWDFFPFFPKSALDFLIEQLDNLGQIIQRMEAAAVKEATTDVLPKWEKGISDVVSEMPFLFLVEP